LKKVYFALRVLGGSGYLFRAGGMNILS